MRLSKELIRTIAESIAASLEAKGLAKLKASRKELAEKIAGTITDDLMAEERLNREVEKLLAPHESEIAGGNLDYRKLFELTRQKLAKERGIVL